MLRHGGSCIDDTDRIVFVRHDVSLSVRHDAPTRGIGDTCTADTDRVSSYVSNKAQLYRHLVHVFTCYLQVGCACFMFDVLSPCFMCNPRV